MTLDDYNEMGSEQRARLQWYFWETYLSFTSKKFNQFAWFRFYGTKGFLASRRDVSEEERYLFEREELLLHIVSSFDIINQRIGGLSPLHVLKTTFRNANYVICKRHVEKARFYWLDRSIKKGERFEIDHEATVTSCSLWGVAVKTSNGPKEVPMQCFIPVN